MEYFLTSEFWWNMLWGSIACLLLTASVASAMYALISLFASEADDWKEMAVGSIVMAVVFFFLGRCFFDGIRYVYVWEENRGPVIILAREAPLLHNYFCILGRSLSHTNEQIQKLNTERDNSTTSEAKKVYETQIAQQENRKKELEGMRYQIVELAQRLYFSKYLARLGHISTDKDIEQKLEEVQKACDLLLHEE